MSNSATYAFILNGCNDWKKSIPEDWNWDIVELEGNEKVIGHHKIDGAVYRILQAGTKVIAITK